MIYVWIDLETTGLNPRTNDILEIGLRATTPDFGEIDGVPELSLVINPQAGVGLVGTSWKKDNPIDIGSWSPAVVGMHSKNGLLTDLVESKTNIVRAEIEIKHWLDTLRTAVGEGPSFIMAGSSVGQFDRQFFAAKFPILMDRFHYRVIDVSTVKMLVASWCGDEHAYQDGKKLHRALPDIQDSIDELVYYADNYFCLPEDE